uniref:Delta carbonic anhydrase n=1 Tax=Helicotheca tamesis TaxID=374047 RepID=A0A7S2HVS4_9STRA|mmetsp:Transcript_3016/g.4079  ORF Transcript_3016/g.4079 Transcript_3016/m.4079 type:complete len:384 (+) Transcript_3016:142-1293(+)
MCPGPEGVFIDEDKSKTSNLQKAVVPLAVVTVISVCCMCATAIIAATRDYGGKTTVAGSSLGGSDGSSGALPTIVVNVGDNDMATRKPGFEGENICAGARPWLDNVKCISDAIDGKPQAGANVTKGYKGDMEVDHVPIDTPYWQHQMCPVNVHWHFGAEHYSYGEYDEFGSGPILNANVDNLDRRLELNARKGFQCRLYDKEDPKFNTPYVWKHCLGMEVGETYEVHWPHSAAGACGTVNQYQTPFYDGVFCNIGVLGDLSRTQEQIGVQAQIFTLVNDENYYYPDLMRGMIMDGDFGKDIAYYTGSTTGTTRDNEMCSQYSPITWQVDRKCHMISASSFDKMCADMKSQRDDMSDDLVAHGSRELVDDAFAANNGKLRALRA